MNFDSQQPSSQTFQNLVQNSVHTLNHDTQTTALSPDGHTVAYSCGDRLVKFYDAKTGQRSQTLVHPNPILACAFSPSGWGIVTAGTDGMIWLWNLETNRCFGKLQGHTGWIYTLDLSSVDDILASGSTDNTVRLWNVATNNCIAVFEGHERPVQKVAFNPTGVLLATYSDDQAVKIWDIQTSECIKTYDRSSLNLSFSSASADLWAWVEAEG